MRRLGEQGEWRFVYGAAVLLILALFLYSVRPVLGPFILFLLLLLLLLPYAGTRFHLLLVIASTALVGLWLLDRAGFLLAPFILALVLAYILNPVVDVLERWRLPRRVAIAVLALPGIGLVALAVFVGIPALADQVEALIERAPAAAERVAAWAERVRQRILTTDLPFIEESVFLRQLEAFEPERVAAYLEARRGAILDWLWQGFLGVTRGVSVVLTVGGYVILTPVLTAYLLQDYHGITERGRSLIPVDRREGVLAFLREYDASLSRYLRGQVLEAALVGVMTWIGLLVLGFPFSGLVGAVAGVFNLVPYLGLIVSLIPGVIIALLSGDVLLSLLKLALVFIVVQVIDSTVTGPRIVGGSVGLHPVWIMLAIAVGGSFFGFVGLLLAVPAALLIKLLFREGIERYRRSALYQGDAAAHGES